MAQTSKSILPVFLWKHIFAYLPIDFMLKVLVTSKYYDRIVDWKYHFLKRTHAIVIVRCESKVMDNFWKYAFYSYVICHSIDDALNTIDSDNKSNAIFNGSKMYYYKVFIKAGNYSFKYDHNSRDYIFYHAKCSIELIGNNSVIDGGNIIYDKTLYCSQLLSVKNITFTCITIKFSKYNNNLNDYIISELNINNCVFKNEVRLLIDSVDNATITNCRFVDAVYISVTEMYYQKTIRLFPSKCNHLHKYHYISCNGYNICPDSIKQWRNGNANAKGSRYCLKLNYTISGNTFSTHVGSKKTCIYFKGYYDELSNIEVTNNDIKGGATVLNFFVYHATIFFNNNRITDTDLCIENRNTRHPANIVIRNNLFTRVKKICSDNKASAIKIDDNNTFINCGFESINYIKP